MRSDPIKKGVIRAPHRSLLRATGVISDPGDFNKPFIAIANSFTQIIPGHAHLDEVGTKVRQAVYDAGGIPFEFTVNEQLHYENMGFDDPKRCSDCRKRKTRQTESQDGWKKLYRKSHLHSKDMPGEG